MTIETKFNVGDKVFFMKHNSVDFGTIIGIDITVKKGNIFSSNPINLDETVYIISEICRIREHNLFRTKEELINTL